MQARRLGHRLHMFARISCLSIREHPPWQSVADSLKHIGPGVVEVPQKRGAETRPSL